MMKYRHKVDATALLYRPKVKGRSHLRGMRKIKRVSLTQQEVFKKYCESETHLNKLRIACAQMATALMHAIEDSRGDR